MDDPRIPLLTAEDRRAKEAILALAEHQIEAAMRVRDRIRGELGLPPGPKLEVVGGA